MKKYLFSFFAIAIGIVALSFTQPESVSRTNYYWFDHSNNAIIYFEEAQKANYESATDIYGCPSSGSYVCTKAFALGDTEPFNDGGTIKRRPIAGKTPVFTIQKPLP